MRVSAESLALLFREETLVKYFVAEGVPADARLLPERTEIDAEGFTFVFASEGWERPRGNEKIPSVDVILRHFETHVARIENFQACAGGANGGD